MGGRGRFSEKTRNGSARVKTVPVTAMATMMICWVSVIVAGSFRRRLRGGRLGCVAHWSRNITTKSAVIAKESPVASKGSRWPKMPPITAPETQ